MNTKIKVQVFPLYRGIQFKDSCVCGGCLKLLGLLSGDLQLIDERSSDITDDVLRVLVL